MCCSFFVLKERRICRLQIFGRLFLSESERIGVVCRIGKEPCAETAVYGSASGGRTIQFVLAIVKALCYEAHHKLACKLMRYRGEEFIFFGYQINGSVAKWSRIDDLLRKFRISFTFGKAACRQFQFVNTVLLQFYAEICFYCRNSCFYHLLFCVFVRQFYAKTSSNGFNAIFLAAFKQLQKQIFLCFACNVVFI